ncbi:rRNA methyltransferase 3A, mitochondrial [Dunckerocampus dactyliophorus]|uniref:rRNA methyltransferase 3A, mitochondrial n=1 Tax=Dunckerocampus dactyliophorus TaxID=161453 RepID=UPI0024055B2B|nr:rRNA methyltransferase 3A, mitochondrial [Dunckerocampus dactyliophorus]
MAIYMKHMSCLFRWERAIFLSRGSGFNVECKRYVRGLRRKPVRVILPEYVKAPPAAIVKEKKDVKVQFRAAELERGDLTKTRTSSEISSSTKSANMVGKSDQIDGLRFERAFPGDKRLARLVSVARSRTFREQQGKVLLEGRRLICDALNAGAIPQTVFFSTADRLRELPVDQLRRATLVKVKFEDIKLWSDLVAPQGVIAIFSRPDASRLSFIDSTHSVPLSLICDNIRDPGNLGTMLRCAAAAGCHSVLLTKGCVDVWEPKVLRAAMGAHFHLPIYPSLKWEEVEDHLPKDVTVHIADSTSGSDPNRESQMNTTRAPSKPGDYGWVSVKPGHQKAHFEECDSESDSDSEYAGLSLPRVDAKLYHENWAQSPTAIVIGGETQGLSMEAVQLAEKTTGHRLFIPIVPDVDSLNSAMAASILLFEGRKQLLKAMQTSRRKWSSKAERQLS